MGSSRGAGIISVKLQAQLGAGTHTSRSRWKAKAAGYIMEVWFSTKDSPFSEIFKATGTNNKTITDIY